MPGIRHLLCSKFQKKTKFQDECKKKHWNIIPDLCMMYLCTGFRLLTYYSGCVQAAPNRPLRRGEALTGAKSVETAVGLT